MASYGSTAAASEPLVAKPQGASLKGLIAGAAGASFVLGALAATAISATVQTQTALYSPLYEFEQISEDSRSTFAVRPDVTSPLPAPPPL